MSGSISVPLDDGFLRRECPHCERQFKWHHGPIDNRPDDIPDPAVYFCPYCGQTATPDGWWTTEQLEYVQHFALVEGTREIETEMKKMARNSKDDCISFEFKGLDVGDPPRPLHEPNDMVLVEPPCHPWEPVKVDETWTGSLHCLMCGSEFTLG